jgi:hypothetical protein
VEEFKWAFPGGGSCQHFFSHGAELFLVPINRSGERLIPECMEGRLGFLCEPLSFHVICQWWRNNRRQVLRNEWGLVD